MLFVYLYLSIRVDWDAGITEARKAAAGAAHVHTLCVYR